MFNAKGLAVKGLTVVGKLLILLGFNTAIASPLENPKFFEYKSSSFINRVAEFSFGFFKTLDDEQKEAYNQSVVHALMYAENGQTVRWYLKDASGETTPVMTWSTGSGYCRRLHVQAIAYSTEKTMSATACYDNASRNWRWTQ